MTSRDLSDSLIYIDDELLESAGKRRRKKKKKIGIAAAVILLCAAVLGAVLLRNVPETPLDLPPRVVVDGKTYIISAHPGHSYELEEDYVSAGKIKEGVFEGKEYYQNPDNPWVIYILQPFDTTGESGRGQYIRFAEEHIRGKYLIYVNGALYEFEEGNRTDNLPDGFEFTGEVSFIGYDTVPENELESNYTDIYTPENYTRVYTNPENSEIIYVNAIWYTAPDANGEQVHYGYREYTLSDLE